MNKWMIWGYPYFLETPKWLGSMGYDSPTYKWGIPWDYNPLILNL